MFINLTKHDGNHVIVHLSELAEVNDNGNERIVNFSNGGSRHIKETHAEIADLILTATGKGVAGVH